MKQTTVTGNAGLRGWIVSPTDLELYLGAVNAYWGMLAGWWCVYRPAVTRLRIAYDQGNKPAAIVTPSDHFIMMLRLGGVVRHMRQIDEFGQSRMPVFEGTGNVMRSMSEREAIEFLAWKDIPRGVNHWSVVDVASLPSRERRKAWRLMENGQVGVLQ